MAYITASDAKMIREALKAAFPEIKFSVRVRHHSSLDVTIVSSPVVFATNDDGSIPKEVSINQYHLSRNGYQNVPMLEQMIHIIKTASSRKWYDNSDAMTDYFDTAFYFSITQGAWDKPFELKSRKASAVKRAAAKAVPAVAAEETPEFKAWAAMRELMSELTLSHEVTE